MNKEIFQLRTSYIIGFTAHIEINHASFKQFLVTDRVGEVSFAIELYLVDIFFTS